MSVEKNVQNHADVAVVLCGGLEVMAEVRLSRNRKFAHYSDLTRRLITLWARPRRRMRRRKRRMARARPPTPTSPACPVRLLPSFCASYSLLDSQRQQQQLSNLDQLIVAVNSDKAPISTVCSVYKLMTTYQVPFSQMGKVSQIDVIRAFVLISSCVLVS